MATTAYPERLQVLLTLGDPRPEDQRPRGAEVDLDEDGGFDLDHEHGEGCGCGPEGGVGSPEQWADYGAMGITKEDEAQLVAMATDRRLLGVDDDSPAGFGPIHAWRALGRMRSEAAIKPLADVLDYLVKVDHEWGLEELPEVFAAIGPASLGELRRVLPDQRRDMWARVAAANGIRAIAARHPAHRDEAVKALIGQLSLASFNDTGFNGVLVGNLLDLRAVDAESAIRRAYEGGHVDETICGDVDEAINELHRPPADR